MKKDNFCIEHHIVKLDNLPDGTQMDKLSDEELLNLMKQCNYFQNNACYMASDAYISREIAGEVVLVPMDDLGENGMVTFNETGAFLWKMLKKKQTAGDLVYALQQEFNVSCETADADVQLFLDSALRCGMIKKT